MAEQLSPKMFVKPSPGILVRCPEKEHAHLPEAGDWVPRNAYWLRRVKDGDVVIAKPPQDGTALAVPPKKTSAKE